MPCTIRNITDGQAITQMVEDNADQRENILPSERAKALKMQLDAIKRQSARGDLGAPGMVRVQMKSLPNAVKCQLKRFGGIASSLSLIYGDLSGYFKGKSWQQAVYKIGKLFILILSNLQIILGIDT